MNDVLKQNHNNVPPPTTPKPPFDKNNKEKSLRKNKRKAITAPQKNIYKRKKTKSVCMPLFHLFLS